MFINETGLVASVITGMTGFAGSTFLSLLIILIVLLVACMALGFEIEWVSVLMLPLCLTLWAYNSSFTGVGGVMLIYLGLVMAKNFFIR